MTDILFVSSKNTGYGHQSIVESLCEKIEPAAPELKVEITDAFELAGKLPTIFSKMYNFVVVNFPTIWAISYEFGNIFPHFVNYHSSLGFCKNFKKFIKNDIPKLIVVLHPSYVTPVHSALKDMKLDIPVMVFVADFDNVSKLWANKQTKYTICPSENAKRTMLKAGMAEDRLRIMSFPARDRFNHCVPPTEDEMVEQILKKDQLTFLLLNGSQGTSYFIKTARILLNSFNCKVIIISGRNELLKSRLENKLIDTYGDRVEVLGFTKNIEHYMCMSDIVVVRASPNVVTEAVNLCKPIIVTGAFTGQEVKNPQFVLDNKLGIVCRKTSALPSCVKSLLDDNGSKLREIYRGQQKYRNTSSAREISEFIISNI